MRYALWDKKSPFGIKVGAVIRDQNDGNAYTVVGVETGEYSDQVLVLSLEPYRA